MTQHGLCRISMKMESSGHGYGCFGHTQVVSPESRQASAVVGLKHTDGSSAVDISISVCVCL